MFCQMCGNQVKDNEKFCSKCGSPVNRKESSAQQDFYQDNYKPEEQGGQDASMDAYVQETSYEPVTQYEPEPVYGGYGTENTADNKKSSSKNGKIILLAAILAVLVVCIVAAVKVGPEILQKFGIGEDTTFSDEDDSGYSSAEQEDETEKITKDTSETGSPYETSNDTLTVAATTDASGKETVVPERLFDGAIKYVKNATGLALRKGPGTKYDKISTLLKGTSVQVKGENDGEAAWVYVCVNGTVYGWVETQYLSDAPLTSTTQATTLSSDPMIYTKLANPYQMYVNDKEGLHMRKGPSQSFESYGVMRENTVVTVIGISAYDPQWYYIRATVGGVQREGFSKSTYLTKVS